MGLKECLIEDLTERALELCRCYNSESSKIEIDVGVSHHTVAIRIHRFEKDPQGRQVRVTERVS